MCQLISHNERNFAGFRHSISPIQLQGDTVFDGERWDRLKTHTNIGQEKHCQQASNNNRPRKFYHE
jgi:hypothetical protein